MNPSEILRNVRRIEIKTRRLVNDVLAGEYHSVFKGRGMEFEEVREYEPGDDVRTIDWNVTARTGVPHVKRFKEERELTVLLVVDVSASGAFGTSVRQKNRLATEVSALLAFSAIRNNDRVGLVLFTDRVERFIPPKKGREHVLRLIRELLTFTPEHKGTDLAAALDYVGRVQRRRSVVFLLSDFLGEDFDQALRGINRRHDLVTMSITDPLELELPPVGFLELEDAETGEVVIVDTADIRFYEAFKESNQGVRDQLTNRLDRMQIDHIPLGTDDDYVKPLIRFFHERSKRM